MRTHPPAYQSRTRAGLVLALAIVAASCGGGTADTPSPAPSAAAAATAASAVPSGNEVALQNGQKVTLPKAEKTDLKIGTSSTPSTSSGNTPLMLRQLDLFKKYGLNVTYQQFNGAAAAMQALLAGQVDMSDNSEGPVLATVGTSSPMQFVFVPRANMLDILYAQASVKTASDLRGKTIAVSSFGSNSYAGAIYALKALNLTEKDVTITAVGNDTQRLAALKSGAVAASIQDNTLEKDLKAAGFNSLVRLGDIKPAFGQPGAGTVIPIDFLKKYPNTVLSIVAATLEANWLLQTRPPKELAALFAKELKDTPLDELERQLALVQQEPFTPKDGLCRAEDVQFGKQIAVVANPNLASVDPLVICNNDFLNKLKSLGFQHQLGIPGY